MSQELLLAHLERDAVDYAFALTALQAFLDDIETRRVDHQRHLANLGIRRKEIDELAHLCLCIEQAIIHVDVDCHCSVIHLLSGNVESFVVVLLADQAKELTASCHVASFANVEESRVIDYRRLKTRKTVGCERLVVHGVRLNAFIDKLTHCSDMGWRGAAAAADDIDEVFGKERTHLPDHHLWRIVVGAELIRQTCIRVTTDEARGRTRHLAQVRQHARCSESAVET